MNTLSLVCPPLPSSKDHPGPVQEQPVHLELVPETVELPTAKTCQVHPCLPEGTSRSSVTPASRWTWMSWREQSSSKNRPTFSQDRLSRQELLPFTIQLTFTPLHLHN
jgi:hypothetical protein